VRRIHRRGLQRLDHDRLDHIVTDRARRARARRVDQAFQPVGGEPVTPLRDRDPVTAQLRRDRGVRPPRAQASTILDRNASACDDEGRRAHRCYVCRSCSVNTTATVGRPARPITRLLTSGRTPGAQAPGYELPEPSLFANGTT